MKRANAFKIIKTLLKFKLVVHYGKAYDGYKLNYLGYDFLAIYTLLRRGNLAKVMHQVGIGKESGILKLTQIYSFVRITMATTLF